MPFRNISLAEIYADLGQAISAENAISSYQTRQGIPSTINTPAWMRPPPANDATSDSAHALRKIVQDTNRREFETRIANQLQERRVSVDLLFEDIHRPGYDAERLYRELIRRRQNLLDQIREQPPRSNPTPPQTPPPTTDRKPPPTSLDNAPSLRTAQTSGARAPTTATAPPRPAQPSHWNLYQPIGATPPPATREIPRPLDAPPPGLPQAAARGRLGYGAAGAGLDLGLRLAHGQDIGQAAYGAAGGLAGGLAGQGLGQAIGAGLGLALGGPPGAAVGGMLGGLVGQIGGAYTGGSLADRYYPGNNAGLGGNLPGMGYPYALALPPNPLGLSPGAPRAPIAYPAASGLLGFEQIWEIRYSVRWTSFDGSPGFYQNSTGPMWGSPPILSLATRVDVFGRSVFGVKVYSRNGTDILPNGQPNTAPSPEYYLADIWLGASYKSGTQPALTILSQSPFNYLQPNAPPAIPRPVDPAYTPTPQNAPRPNPNNSPSDQYHPNPLPQNTPSPSGQPTGEPLPGNLGGNEPQLQPQRSPDGTPQPTPGDRAYPPGARSSGAGRSGNSGFPTTPVAAGLAAAATLLPSIIRLRIQSNAQRPIPTTQPRGSGSATPPPPPATPEEPCRGNRCAQRQLRGIDDANTRLLRLEQGLLGGADLAANAAILRKLNEIDAKLGPQITGGGIGNFIKKMWDSMVVQKILNILTFVTVLHNAYMLSSNLSQTLFSAFDNILEFFGAEFKDSNGQDVSTSQWAGNAIEGFFNGIFGTETVNGIQSNWKKFNRIYQAASNILSSFQSMIFSVLESLEVVGNYVALIGNASKKFGVFTEKCYRWMNPNLSFTTNRYFNALNNVGEAVESIDEVTGEALNIQQTGAELFNQQAALRTAVEEVIPGDQAGKDSSSTDTPQHLPSSTFESKLISESQKVLLPIPDTAEVRQD